MYPTPYRFVLLTRTASAAAAACTTFALFSAVAFLAEPQQSTLWALDHTRHDVATHPTAAAPAHGADTRQWLAQAR